MPSPTSNNASPVEVDPARDFLERERASLEAILGPKATSTDDMAESPVGSPSQESITKEVASLAIDVEMEGPSLDEPQAMSEWRRSRDAEIAEREAEHERKHQEMLQSARADLKTLAETYHAQLKDRHSRPLDTTPFLHAPFDGGTGHRQNGGPISGPAAVDWLAIQKLIKLLPAPTGNSSTERFLQIVNSMAARQIQN